MATVVNAVSHFACSIDDVSGGIPINWCTNGSDYFDIGCDPGNSLQCFYPPSITDYTSSHKLKLHAEEHAFRFGSRGVEVQAAWKLIAGMVALVFTGVVMQQL
ncbi:hypothetical protein K438DRAFT_2015570 [Mycena galopus ATCC 62051]|nr:hypothetical protein K438DRAFT_2015570 [Mycena galopus ATCC 62051]